MRQTLIDFLKALEARIPPPAKCHHALTYARYGNDEDGWSDRLALQVNRNGQVKCLFIDDGDLENDQAVLIEEIASL